MKVVASALNMAAKKNFIDRFVLNPWHCVYFLRGGQRVDIMEPDADFLDHKMVSGIVSQDVLELAACFAQKSTAESLSLLQAV